MERRAHTQFCWESQPGGEGFGSNRMIKLLDLKLEGIRYLGYSSVIFTFLIIVPYFMDHAYCDNHWAHHTNKFVELICVNLTNVSNNTEHLPPTQWTLLMDNHRISFYKELSC